jgi:hypothetical protein
MAYDVGDLVRFSATCQASGGAFADASSIYFLYTRTLGPATHLYGLSPSQIVRQATGCYYIDVTIDAVGGWAVRWQATGGPFQSAQEYTFQVNPTFTH